MSRPIQVEAVRDVGERARLLGLIPPEGAAFLPSNFFVADDVSDLFYEGNPLILTSRLEEAGVPVSRIEPVGTELPLMREKSGAALILPTLFLGASLWSQNPELVNVALGVVANYATDMFKWSGIQRSARIELVVPPIGSTESTVVRYDGPADDMEAGLREIVKMIRAAKK